MRFDLLPYSLPDTITYGTLIGGYQFVIVYHKQEDVYSATWKNVKHVDKPATFIGEVLHPDVGLPYFDKMIEAERACEQQYKQLRNPN